MKGSFLEGRKLNNFRTLPPKLQQPELQKPAAPRKPHPTESGLHLILIQRYTFLVLLYIAIHEFYFRACVLQIDYRMMPTGPDRKKHHPQPNPVREIPNVTIRLVPPAALPGAKRLIRLRPRATARQGGKPAFKVAHPAAGGIDFLCFILVPSLNDCSSDALNMNALDS